MLNITHYQRNANQNHNEVPFHASQNGPLSQNLQTINAGEGVEKGNLLTLLVGMYVGAATMEKSMVVP